MSIFYHNRKRYTGDFPPDMIPAPEMTIPQAKAFIQKCIEHPDIIYTGGHITWVVGEIITWCIEKEPKYKTLLIEDFNWEEFEDLRVEWEKDVTIAA